MQTLHASPPVRRPRVGFLGVGWIGRNRMEAVAASGVAEVAAICDPEASLAAAASALVQGAEVAGGFETLLELDLDGIVIATPSALHADQSIAALERGVAVFCQKPLGRNAAEARRVVDAARAADRLLAVDMSYRHTAGMHAVRKAVASGEIGQVYAADLTFHNAYGPDKPWYRDVRLAGGGCVLDLGIHLADLALWTFNFPAVESVQSALYAGGHPLPDGGVAVEDFALATVHLSGGVTVRIACSWNLPAGQDAIIDATFYGTSGGATFRNVNGSFYDFTAELMRGTQRVPLAAPPDDWGGRAAVDWARRLAAGERFDASAAELVRVAEMLDRILGR